MYYKLTLLKDLPKYPAGTKFSYWKGRTHSVFGELMGVYGKSMTNCFPISEELMENPEWIKKKVDRSKLTNIACPECGGTYFELFKDVYRVGNRYDGFHYKADVYLECPCGYERHF